MRYILIDPVGNRLGTFDSEAEAWAWLDENITARGAHSVRPEPESEVGDRACDDKEQP